MLMLGLVSEVGPGLVAGIGLGLGLTVGNH